MEMFHPNCCVPPSRQYSPELLALAELAVTTPTHFPWFNLLSFICEVSSNVFGTISYQQML